MRSHGMPDFPDANSPGGPSPSGINGNSPAVQAALKACQHLLPKDGISSAQPSIAGAGPSASG
jgi:hypothetical protein